MIGLLLVAGGCDHFLLANPTTNPPGTGADGGVIRTPLTRERHVPYFPIGEGSHHTDESCDSCHPSTDTFKEFTCLSCHAHAPDVAATRHVGITGFAYDSAACVSCHPTGGEAPISLHDHSVRFFPIETGKHSTLGCADCHQDPESSDTFTCISCHPHAPDVAAMRHVFITGFVYESKACLKCHPTGGDADISVPDHSKKFFPIDAGSHANLQCADCHDKPGDASQITCVSCHPHAPEVAAMRHVNVADFVYDSAACMRCHPQGARR